MLNSHQRDLIDGLLYGVGGPRLTKSEFLAQFGVQDGVALGVAILADAVARHDTGELSDGLVVTFTFGVSEDHLPLLIDLLDVSWHVEKEDIVSLLGEFHRPDLVDTLVHAMDHVPDYLEFEDGRSLFDKAISAIRDTPGEYAEAVLVNLADSTNPLIRDRAGKELARRRCGWRPGMP